MAALYDMSAPLLTQGLKSLKHILQKGEAWAKENDVPVERLLTAKLADDMLPLTFQIQSCSDNAKNVLVRLLGHEPIKMVDNEKTFEELYARIDKTLALFDNVEPSAFEGKAEIEVVLPFKPVVKFTGLEYLQKFVLPNFFFHETVAYALLRKEGVPVGKLDYLNAGVMPGA